MHEAAKFALLNIAEVDGGRQIVKQPGRQPHKTTAPFQAELIRRGFAWQGK